VPELFDELIARVAAELKRPVKLDPALDLQVMAEVRSRPRGRRPWLLRPRMLSLTPIGILARAAAIAAIAAGATLAALRMRSAPPAAAGVAERSVAFVIYAPAAQSVALAGDFNDWSTTATRLRPAGASGAWVVTVPLTPGRYHYAFVINGKQWLTDPGAPRAPGDDFGAPSSVLTVGG
jgi:Carbohydrate-binding module 48 (Isoamylase N-terminal domain)